MISYNTLIFNNKILTMTLRTPILLMLPKIHRNTIPMKPTLNQRNVVSQISNTYYLKNYQLYLKKTIKSIPCKNVLFNMKKVLQHIE